jgi:ABC-2 type transport system permease protein
VIFGYAFRIDEDYTRFFLPGMIGCMVCSDAIYSIGPVIKKYYTMNIVRYFRGYPVNILSLFVGFVLTRLIFITLSMILLITLSVLLFCFNPSLVDLGRYLAGTFFIFTTYSFIGISISFYGIEDNKDHGIIGIYYLVTIFLSDAFFILSKANLFFDILGYFFPLRVMLNFMRGGDYMNLVYSALWMGVSLTIVLIVIRSLKLTR